MTDKIKAYIGLAQRANAVLYGEDIICEKKRLAKVVLVSSTAGDKYRDRIAKKCPIVPYLKWIIFARLCIATALSRLRCQTKLLQMQLLVY